LFIIIENIFKAHHQNHARLALEETIEFENAIGQAKEMLTSSEDTLIIVTADHGQSMLLTGYQERGNDILKFASLSESLIYFTGPGYWYHMANDTKNLFKPINTYISDERENALYMHQSFIGRSDSAHSGEDVGVYATGYMKLFL
jgi:alkaline phosphatase